MIIPCTSNKCFHVTILIMFILCVGGCATSAYMGQAKVDGSDSYIVVGHDGGPNRTIWVIEGTEEYPVTLEDAQ
jgi:hypothetical protein